MGMPNNLILIRHGQSEGNIAVEASKRGDNRIYERNNGHFMTVPGHQWRLTELGKRQAGAIGAWVDSLMENNEISHFHRHYVSPFVRTRETAANLGLSGARWTLNRALRERDWGDIGSMTRADFRARYPDNAHQKKIDPLYWMPVGGESIAHVAENRVRNFLSTMHRECEGENVLAVAHGEVMMAFRMTLEYWKDEDFAERAHTEEPRNCEALHYTRVNPVTGEQSKRFQWFRSATPVVHDDGRIEIVVSEWREFTKPLMSNDDLLDSISKVPSLLASTD